MEISKILFYLALAFITSCTVIAFINIQVAAYLLTGLLGIVTMSLCEMFLSGKFY